MDGKINDTPLKSLTSICLQETDTILNTLLFMCLDQGHDFHDGSARTKTNDGKTTWVDLDFNGKGYLNKIETSIFQKEYAPNEGENKVNVDKIFGKNDFITGLLNTTFIGGKGNFGLVMIENEYLENYEYSNDIEKKIQDKINANIKVNLDKMGDKYYIYCSNDHKGEYGIEYLINDSDDEENNIYMLFLPFYQRVYNGDMHKLWSFNTKKHIYIIKLDEITIFKDNNGYFINNHKFICKKLSIIDLIVPQYIMNYPLFFVPNKISKNAIIKKEGYFLSELSNKLNKQIKNDKNTLTVLHDLVKDEINEKIITNIFFNSLLTNQFLSNEDKNIIFSVNTEQYNNFIPRGAKYYFSNCQDTKFNFFLKLLYKYEKPFIHPLYNPSNNSKIINARNEIINNLKNNLQEYINYKNNKEIISENNEYFISKQYGFITDTNIGSEKKNSTADYLINFLNNVENEFICNNYKLLGGAGELAFLKEIKNLDEDEIELIEKGSKYRMVKDYIENVYNEIKNINILEKQSILEKKFTDYLKSKFKSDITNIDKIKDKVFGIEPALSSETMDVEIIPELKKDVVRSKRTREDISEPLNEVISFKRRKPESSISGLTTAETNSYTSDVEIIPKITTDTPTETFNNIENVNKIFNLSLTEKELIENNFTKINSMSTSNNLLKYSNKLQLYYEFIPQNSNAYEMNNYFNNCWQSIDFYQKQQGGTNYPFKFSIASGSLDSSSLGGQSIPQYHPPEIDIYMPIFDLFGNLNGVIVRMVFVKEILNNSINSKSHTFVFCHFVYVDFKRTNIKQPKDISEYPIKFKELLEYTINNTFYISKNSECINLNKIDEFKNDLYKLNNEDNIEFELRLFGDDGEKKRKRNWYKYFTHTQGPTVKDSIVIPTDSDTLDALKIKAKRDYVAFGILIVAEYLIKNSVQLRLAFGINNLETPSIDELKLELFFIKLFLIRNKYTGDKSRSTDTLFLNQVKQIEGVQISNDENTLYNSQIFGLNTIWSTSAKSVFYMAPYITEENKVPVTTGSYLNELCEGLKNNPYIKTVYKSNVIIDASDMNEEGIFINEFYDDLSNTINENINQLLQENTIAEQFGRTLFNLSKLRELVEKIKKYKEEFSKDVDAIYNRILNDVNNNENYILLNRISSFFKELCSSKTNEISLFNFNYNKELVDKNYISLYKSIINFIGRKYIEEDINKRNKNILTINLKSFLLFLSKKVPFWTGLILENIDIDYSETWCSIFKKILDVQTKLLLNPDINIENKLTIYFDIKSIIRSFTGECSNKKCFDVYYNENDPNGKSIITKQGITKFVKMINEKKPLITINYLPPSIKNKYLEETNIAEKVEENENQFINISEYFLKKIENKAFDYFNEKIKDKLIDNSYIDKIVKSISKIELYDVTILKYPEQEIKPTSGLFKIQPPKKRIKVKGTFGGSIKTNEEIKLDGEELTQFYNDTNKCNIGNYLKSFIRIINNIHNNSKYTNLEINFDTDNNKEIVIKIFLKNIKLINSSFIPNINHTNILNVLEKIETSYSIERLNTILNLYSTQLNIYSNIYFIDNSIKLDENDDAIDYLSNTDLVNLLDSINNYTYEQLYIPLSKNDLEKKILNSSVNIPGITMEVQEYRIKKLQETQKKKSSEKDEVNEYIPLSQRTKTIFDLQKEQYNPSDIVVEPVTSTTNSTRRGGKYRHNKAFKLTKRKNHTYNNKSNKNKYKKARTLKKKRINKHKYTVKKRVFI